MDGWFETDGCAETVSALTGWFEMDGWSETDGWIETEVVGDST